LVADGVSAPKLIFTGAFAIVARHTDPAADFRETAEEERICELLSKIVFFVKDE
jgi:hypothetical protein